MCTFIFEEFLLLIGSIDSNCRNVPQDGPNNGRNMNGLHRPSTFHRPLQSNGTVLLRLAFWTETKN